jgi:hypothetical protein
VDGVRDFRYVWLLKYDSLDSLCSVGYMVFVARDVGG